MGTYENFYLNQIKQLQEENNKLKQIIDEGILSGNIVSAAVRGLEKKKQRDIEKTKLMIDRIKPRRLPPGYGPSSDRPAPVVPGRSDPEGYASDDMESRRTRPGYGISSDSQGAGPMYDLPIRKWDAIKSTRRERGFLDDVDGYRF